MSTGKRLRVGIVGCGAVAEIYHLPAVARSPQAVLAAVVDSDAARARAAAARHRAGAWFSDYRELAGRVDAAVVATSNASHAEIACFLLQRGVHVLCEKPMATSVEDARRIFAAARDSGARLMAGHCRRFNPNVALLRELVARGAIGPITRISAALGGKYGQWPQRTDFRRQRSLAGGGVLVDLGVHLVDLVVWLAGERPTVTTYEGSDALGWGIETDAEVRLALPEGGEALLSCSYTHGSRRTLRVDGRDGWAETSLDGAPSVTVASRRAAICRRTGAQDFLVPEADPYERQLEHFASGVLHEHPFVVRPAEVLAGLRVIEDCYQLARAA